MTPGTPDKNYIDIWQQSDRLATKSVNVNDHSYKSSNRKLDHKSSTHELGGINTEHYDFYTGFATKEEAATYAQVRAQDYNTQSKRINAAGNVLTIAPGQTFTLSRHPHNAANTEHLIIHAEYDLKEAGYASGTQQSHYRIRFTAIPLTYQYRTPRVTPKPQIIGSQAATVTGPAGEEVHTNEYGDIKVQFHWDRYGTKNEKSSDWIRVAQGSAGGSFGSINTPRIGEEVLIDFINGDSDRPIVIGRLYNSANPPPWGYPQAAKQSGIKSKSFNSPLENYNELMFNDDAGFELVNLQAQRDLNSLVKNDETRTVNRDRTTTIDKDETVTVHGKRTEVVDKDEHITIHQHRTEIVDQNETITIHKNRKERVDLDETIDIGGNRTETVHKSEQILIKGNRDKTINGNDTLNVDKNRKENVHKSRSLNVDKNNTELVKMAKSVTVGLAYATQVGTIMNTAVGIMQTEQIGRIKKTFVGKSYSITAGDEFKITVGKSSLVMNADGSIIITGSTIVTQAEKENKVIGKDVLINPPGASAGGSQADEPSSGSVSDASNIPGIVGGGFGGGLKGQPAQRGLDGLPIQGSDSDEYESNIAVDNYDKDSNYLGSYSLDDNPSGLSAFVPIVVGGEAAIAGAGAIVGGTIYEASKDSGEAIVNAAKSANKTMEGFRAAQMVMAASIANSVQGIFSSDGPKTGNDALDDVFEDSKKSDEGEYGYKYPGTQDELVENLGGIEGAVQDIRDNGTSTTTLPDGRKISTYPARGSNGKPGFSISRPNKRKPAHKGDTQ